MSKFVSTTFGNKKEILKFPDHFVAVGVMVDDTGIVADADGKKIVPAGTIIAGDPVVKTNTADATGVLLNDIDVTYGPASGSKVIHGFIDTTKLPETPTADAIAALKQITFLA